MSQESPTFVESTGTANLLAKAESWLSWVAEHVEMAPDQEALVYLRSRGHDCHDQVTALVESWKRAEQARFDEYNQDLEVLDLRSGKTRSQQREREANVTNFAEISPIFLRDFWDTAPLGETSLEASMLRTVDWCGITGFEPWWRRLAQSRKEMQLHGGMEESAPAAYWLFNMVRSEYAIELMPRVLDGYLESVTLVGLNKRQPWIFDGSLGSACLEQHLAYASAIVFAYYRLRSARLQPELVQQAVETICRHQENGAWRTSTGDAHVSIESTAMALHALALAQPPGWPRMAAGARDWLWSKQKDDGSWNEPGASGPVHLSVLVLDAIALANGDKNVTFRWRPAPQEILREDGRGQPAAELGPHMDSLSSGLMPGTVAGGAKGIPENRDADTTSEPSLASLEAGAGTMVAQQRRAAVNAYLEEVFLKTKRRITRKDFRTASGYKDATEFERWQRNDPKTTKAARKAFARTLTQKPHLK